MKTNKLLKSSMSVALALTISSITAQAWPTNNNIAKADFGDTAATQQTKTELNEIINKFLTTSLSQIDTWELLFSTKLLTFLITM